MVVELIEKTHQPINWDILTLAQARESQSFHEELRNPRSHASFAFTGLSDLIGHTDPDQIARRLSILNEINVIDPTSIGKPHSTLEANRLRRILTRYPHYQQNDQNNYEYIIDNLNNGQLGVIQNALGDKRKALGIATPFSTELLMSALAKAAGIDKDFPTLTFQDIQQVLSSSSTDSEELLKNIDPNYIFTTTGTGRNLSVREIFRQKWKTGSYIEVGGSVGIHPFEISQDLGFESAVSVDIIPNNQADLIASITDYSAGKSVPLTEELRQQIANNVKRYFSFDARLDDLQQITRNESARPLVAGIHNLLVHLIGKDAVIANAVRAIKNGHNYLWTSGGCNGNDPILYNFILEFDNGEVIKVFKDQYNRERTGGKGVDIVTEEDMQNVFEQERA